MGGAHIELIKCIACILTSIYHYTHIAASQFATAIPQWDLLHAGANCLFVFLFVCLFVCVFVWLFVCLFVCLCVCWVLVLVLVLCLGPFGGPEC